MVYPGDKIIPHIPMVSVTMVITPIYREFKMGSQVEDQQVSCLWQGSHLLSVSLSGFINYLDVNNPDKPLRVIRVRPASDPTHKASWQICIWLPGDMPLYGYCISSDIVSCVKRYNCSQVS